MAAPALTLPALGRSLLELLREERCLCCGTPVPFAELGDSVLCSGCRPALSRRVRGFCPSCGELMAWPDQENAPCGRCLREAPPWRRFFFHGAYEDRLRDLVLRLKDGRELALARGLGSLLARHPDLTPEYDALVPAPMHGRRLRERGFNQALELARPVAGALRAPLAPELLRRHKAARPQTGLSRAERRANLRGVFAASEAVRDKRLLLVDDIATTGATLEQATRALLQAGAIFVDVAVLARTPAHPAFHA